MGNAKGTIGFSAAGAVVAAFAVLLGCTGRTDPGFIGSAIVETQTYQVSALTQGRLVGLYKQEGQTAVPGELVAVVDTVPYFLQLQESQGNLTQLIASTRAKENDLKANQAEIRGLEKDYARITPLVKEGSLPPQQEDKLTSSLDAARARYSAGKDVVASMVGNRQGLEARMAQIREQIEHCYLRAPASGRILTRYKNPEGTVAPGQPVYEIGQEDTLRVDFFVPQT
jgi:multidrug resistance efflux pump